MKTSGLNAKWIVVATLILGGPLFSTRSPTQFRAAEPASQASANVGAARGVAKRRAATLNLDDPTSAGLFRGRVTGPEGEPIAGARIHLAPYSKRPASQLWIDDIGPVRAQTDDDGRFEFDAPHMTFIDVDGLASRRHGLVIAAADGFAPDWMQTSGRNAARGGRGNPADDATIELRLAADDVAIHGRLLDPKGRPLAGARVRVVRLMVPKDSDLDAHLDRESKASVHSGFLSGGPDYERVLYLPHVLPAATEARSDADGRFTLAGLGCDRLVELAVSAPDIIDTSLTVMTRDAADVRVRFRDAPPDYPPSLIHGAAFSRQLKSGLTINGLVRNRDTHAPIAGMWVTKYRNPLTDVAARAEAAVTDENGRFSISGLDPVLIDAKEDHREITAFPQRGSQYIMGRAILGPDREIIIDCPR